MRKFIAIFLSLILTFSLTACGTTAAQPSDTTPADKPAAESVEPDTTAAPDEAAKEDPVLLRVAGLKGPTSMGLVNFMDEADPSQYEFTIAGSADELTPKFMQGQLDVISVPANLASILYNKTDGDVVVLNVNTLGVLYIVTKNAEVTSLSDLAGQTVYATGKGSTPEYNLRYLLTEAGLDPDADVTIEWKSEPTEVVALLSNADSGIAMMPQPYVTAAQAQVDGLSVALNLTEEWDSLNNGSRMVTGVTIARKSYVEAHPEAIKAFLTGYKSSVEQVNSDPAPAAALIEKFDIAKAAIAEKAIPYCNITFLTGDEMQTALGGYLEVLAGFSPESVGGSVPAEDFYDTTDLAP